jgi:hypothetical protein
MLAGHRSPSLIILDLMSEVTRILFDIEQGDPSAAEQLDRVPTLR